jgi:hypothetical protein
MKEKWKEATVKLKHAWVKQDNHCELMEEAEKKPAKLDRQEAEKQLQEVVR